MITKQRKVGSSMVLTVPKEFACKTKDEMKQYFEASMTEEGVIIYSPVEIKIAGIDE
jgi:hypothetical protein